MPSEKKDPEIIALEAVHGALRSLDPVSRRRVITSVEALLEISPSTSSTLQPRQSQPSPDERTSAQTQTQRAAVARPLSIIELVQEKRPSTNAEKIALYAYYRERHEGLQRFARTDLHSYFSKAREKPPANFDRDFVEAVKKGWIHEEDSESYLTSKGIEAIESGFPSEGRAPKPSKGPRAKRKTAKKRNL